MLLFGNSLDCLTIYLIQMITKALSSLILSTCASGIYSGQSERGNVLRAPRDPIGSESLAFNVGFDEHA